jgi:hypothetical protein
MSNALLLLVLVGIGSPFSQPVCESVDLIELNHKYDPTGRHTFSQVIFYERLRQNGLYRVRDWVLVDERESICAIPVNRNGLYHSSFIKEGVFYRIRSPLFRESWTHYDPEIEDGRIYPKHTRRLLRRREYVPTSESEE